MRETSWVLKKLRSFLSCEWCLACLLAPRIGAYNLTSVRTSVRPYVRPSDRGQQFLRSVWDNWFETLGQEQVRSEDYARQIDFCYRSKWRPGGHHGCKQTWSRNSNNTNWISFKLGAERTLGMANMYAHLFSVRFKKMTTWRPYLFFDPHDNTVLAYISKILQDRGLVTIIDI